MSVRVAFVFNHWMQSFKAAYDNTCLGQVLSRTSLTLRAGPTAVRKDQFVGFTTRLHCPRLPFGKLRVISGKTLKWCPDTCLVYRKTRRKRCLISPFRKQRERMGHPVEHNAKDSQTHEQSPR